MQKIEDKFFYDDGSILDHHDKDNKDRKLHRLDGPAVIRSNGTVAEWWINGKKHTDTHQVRITCNRGESLLGYIFTKQIKGQKLKVTIDENQTVHFSGPDLDLSITIDGDVHRKPAKQFIYS